MTNDTAALIAEAKASFQQIGDSDWTPQDRIGARLLAALEAARQVPASEDERDALPVVMHKGPHDTDESMFLTAADNLDRGYPLGGGNLTRAVVTLIRREVERARRRPVSATVEDERLVKVREYVARFEVDHSQHHHDADSPIACPPGKSWTERWARDLDAILDREEQK